MEAQLCSNITVKIYCLLKKKLIKYSYKATFGALKTSHKPEHLLPEPFHEAELHGDLGNKQTL